MTFDPILGNVSNKWEIGSENIMCGLTKNQKTKKPKNKKTKKQKNKKPKPKPKPKPPSKKSQRCDGAR
jgi:hypothetical protein